MLSFLRLLLVFAVAAAGDLFMDCPGNRPTWWNFFRRCCDSTQLPKGCECFDISDKSDFKNSFFHLPKCPGDQKVVFTAFSRTNKDTGVTLKAGSGIASSIVSSSRLTKVIVHGFDDTATTGWVVKMKDALLDEGDVNVITVDWSDGAKPPNFFRATANTRVVGAMLARLIQDLKIYKGVSFGTVHLIGHSLGAHITGYAGKEIDRLTGSKIGRITGLDPASPNFELFSSNIRLDKNDAQFVDVIHTDGEPFVQVGFGITYSIGHVDFYPNGGKQQPNCPAEPNAVDALDAYLDSKGDIYSIICSHNMAYTFFTNSISTCRYDPPEGSECTMGYHVSKSCRGDYYPTTTMTEPYCN